MLARFLAIRTARFGVDYYGHDLKPVSDISECSRTTQCTKALTNLQVRIRIGWEVVAGLLGRESYAYNLWLAGEMMTDDLKRMAAEKAVTYIRDGQTVGLGTGSTAALAIEALGRMVKEGLRIRGVPTSLASDRQAKRLGIPIVDLNDVDNIDLTIDGADQITPSFEMIKGGGGALTREKLVAHSTKVEVIVIDEGKLVSQLGDGFKLPVEVLSFAWRKALRELADLGCKPTLRLDAQLPFVTDNCNYIIDCDFGVIANAQSLERQIKLLPGIVESGLFVGLAKRMVIGTSKGIEVRDHA